MRAALASRASDPAAEFSSVLDRSLDRSFRLATVARHYLEGPTVDQIADRLGVRAGTVKSRIHYGVRELRAAYEATQRDPGRTDR